MEQQNKLTEEEKAYQALRTQDMQDMPDLWSRIDALEREPPQAALPFAVGDDAHLGRIELDLAAAAQRQRWHGTFMAPVESALQQLPARGVRVQLLAGDAPSDAWLPLLGGARAA